MQRVAAITAEVDHRTEATVAAAVIKRAAVQLGWAVRAL